VEVGYQIHYGSVGQVRGDPVQSVDEAVNSRLPFSNSVARRVFRFSVADGRSNALPYRTGTSISLISKAYLKIPRMTVMPEWHCRAE
ncbi:MAG: hypothetical protein ACYTG0_47265, partial [Planctomycetota bacterium]